MLTGRGRRVEHRRRRRRLWSAASSEHTAPQKWPMTVDVAAGGVRQRRQVAVYRVQDGRLVEVWPYGDR